MNIFCLCILGITLNNTSTSSAAVADSLSTDTLKTKNLGTVEVVARQLVETTDGYRISISSNKHFRQMQGDKIIPFLPGITKIDDNLRVYGNDVSIVEVNGHEVRLSGHELQTYLSTLDGNRIKSIEVVKSLGANKSATLAGTAKLIITMTYQDDGGNMTVTAAPSFSSTIRSCFPSMNTMMRYGNWSAYAYASAGGAHMTPKNQTEINYGNNVQAFNRQCSHTDNNNASVTLGMGYDFSPNDVATVEYSYDHRGSHGWQEDLMDHSLVGNYANRTTNGSKGIRNNLVADFQHQWSTGNVIISGRYAHGNAADSLYGYRLEDASAWNNHSHNSRRTDLWQATVDVTQTLPEKWGKLSMGASYNDWSSNQTAYNVVTDTEVSRVHLDDRYTYTERTAATYLSYDFRYKAWSGTAGLRYEHRIADPQSSLDDGKDYKQTYDRLFPSVKLNYRFNMHKGHSVSATYNRTLNTPLMQMLNPGRQWKNDFSYSTGNPYLMPAVGNKLSAQLTIFRYYSLQLGYSAMPLYSLVYEQDRDDAQVYYSTYVNHGKTKAGSISASASRFMGRLMYNASVGYTFSQQNRFDEKVNTRYWTIFGMANYSLKHNWQTSVNIFYISPMKLYSLEKARMFSCSIDISKRLLHNSLMLSMRYSFSPRGTDTITVGNMTSCERSMTGEHSVSLTVTYSLPWGKRNNIRKSNDLGNDELRRM